VEGASPDVTNKWGDAGGRKAAVSRQEGGGGKGRDRGRGEGVGGGAPSNRCGIRSDRHKGEKRSALLAHTAKNMKEKHTRQHKNLHKFQKLRKVTRFRKAC
jgi:hypothetical protein